MAKEKITFEQFLETVDASDKTFVKNLHKYLLDQNCKEAYEEKKSGMLASFKHGKPPKAIANFVFRKQGMLVRIYGGYADKYPDFLSTIPDEMKNSIRDAAICKSLVHNTCSTKCSGYDFMIDDEHFQKCRYNCFEFLVSEKNNPFILEFIEHELNMRA